MHKKIIGTKDGKHIELFTLTNSYGLSISISNYGCAICSLRVPDKKSNLRDIVLGFDNVSDYIDQKYYIGTIIGRCANRIKGTEFELNGIKYRLTANEGIHHLHGGFYGFHNIVWNTESITGDRIIFHYSSPDKEEGYPGNLDVRVSYELTADNSVDIQYHAVCDKDTIVNLTNHSYFNLGGHDSGTIEEHTLIINADAFTEIDENCIPTGVIKDVKGTPLDFSKETEIGKRLRSNYAQILLGSGYNHNYVLNDLDKKQHLAAVLKNHASGIQMNVYTTEHGLQLYTGNYLKGDVFGKGGVPYRQYAGVCLETQGFPNAIQNPQFPSVVLKKDEIYISKTTFTFEVF